METKIHQAGDIQMAEAIAGSITISNVEDALDLLGTLYFEGFDRIILHERDITPDFFDLKTGIAGEILQKFSNYRVRLAIVGNFSAYKGNNIRDFIFESNNGKQVNFVESVQEAVARLSV